MDAMPVTLIVKAPNQQFEDQTIKCEITWSIKKLKGYLSEVYPCNPTLEEQKLIYSGQLLSDAVILKDILRQYEGQETHTVHLVYTPKNKIFYSQQTPKKTIQNNSQSTQSQSQSQSQTQSRSQSQFQSMGQSANNSTSDGLRQRNTSTTNTNNQENVNVSQQPFMPGLIPSPQNFFPGMPSFTPLQQEQTQPQQYSAQEYLIAQQMAMQNMMQQMYLQYLNHCTTSSSTGQTPFVPPQGINFPAMPYFPQSVGSTSQFNMGQQLPTQYQNIYDRDQSQTQQQQQQQQQTQPRVQLDRQPVDDENENRDWLEIFYTFSRLIVLLSLVYFYSSPIRCSIVIFVLLLYYLYHCHQRNIRERQAAQPAPDTEADAPPVVPQATEDVVDGNNENNEDRSASSSLENTTENNRLNNDAPADQSDVATSSVNDPEDNSRLPTITLLRTFVLSFFASLIPETPAV